MASLTLALGPSKTSLTPAEREALARILTRLHEIFAGGGLRSVILYGSKARGTSHAHSDIDLLIVHDDQITPKQEEQLNTLLWTIDFDDSFESNFEIFRQPASRIAADEAIGLPFAQNVQREGIVLEGAPISVKNIDKVQIANMELAHARETLAAANLLAEHGFYDKVVSQAYYVFLYAVRAALVAKDITPQSHSGTNTMFGLHLVQAGLVPERFGRLYGQMEDSRLQADYKHERVFTLDDAHQALALARELLAIIEALVPRLLNE